MKKQKQPNQQLTFGGAKTSSAEIDKTFKVLRALNHPMRQTILKFILGKKNKTHVNAIYEAQKWEQSITSQHLAILRKAGAVKTQREGKFIHYSVNEEVMAKYAAAIDSINAANVANN